jgi:hypothetical protein
VRSPPAAVAETQRPTTMVRMYTHALCMVNRRGVAT